MKKFVTFLVVTLLVISMASVGVFAQDITTAISNKATVDGAIGSGEYGAPYAMTAKNSFEFTETGKALPYDINWYFAWQTDAFYVAIEVPTANLKDGDTFQLNFNPGNLIIADENGLFFSAVYSASGMKFMQHNWGTELNGTPDAAGVEIKLTNKIGTAGDNTIIEVELPVTFFKVTQSVNGTTAASSDYKLSGELLCDTFAVVGGAGYAIENATGIKSGDWTIKGLNHASIKLDGNGGGGSGTDPKQEEKQEEKKEDNTSPAPQKKEEQSNTFDLGIVALAAVALSTVSAFKKKH